MIWMNSFVRPPLARRTVFDELRQARDEPVVADAEQRTAWNIADAGRLDHNRARLSLRKALVPPEHVRRDETVVGRAPRHHRRHPRAVGELQPSRVKRAEKTRGGRFCRIRPSRGERRVADPLRRRLHRGQNNRNRDRRQKTETGDRR